MTENQFYQAKLQNIGVNYRKNKDLPDYEVCTASQPQIQGPKNTGGTVRWNPIAMITENMSTDI